MAGRVPRRPTPRRKGGILTTIAAMTLFAAQAGAPAGGRAGIIMIIYIVAFIAIFWFVVLGPSRKMQKKHEQMVNEIKKGDEVMTEGGIIGSVVHVADDRLTIKTAENTRLVIARPKIARVFGAEPETK
jgi:preprotein translocase subunit YajC